MKTVIEIMARSVGARPQQNKNCDVEYLMDAGALERFAELVRADERNRLATKLVQDFKGAFGDDTCASWAVWIREQK